MTIAILVMFAAFLNVIPLRIGQPYKKFSFHIHDSSQDYNFMEKEIRAWTISVWGGRDSVYFKTRDF